MGSEEAVADVHFSKVYMLDQALGKVCTVHVTNGLGIYVKVTFCYLWHRHGLAVN